MPVSAMANSTGKNRANAGSRIVPNPKPEKKVRMEAKNATKQIIRYSNRSLFSGINLSNKKTLI